MESARSSWPQATTRVTAVIGDPVRHSLSPVLHNAAFRSLELDWVYLAFEVPAGGGAEAVEAMRTLGIDGLSVTMPHKEDVAAAVDRLSPTAARLRSVNCVHREGGELVGESTDGSGFVDALRNDEGFEPSGARCVVIGAGGAARAVVLALADAGAADVAVVNRTAERAEAAAALAGAVGRVAEVEVAAEADLVVNATPVGMADVDPDSSESSPVPAALLRPGQVVVDLVYNPLRTPLLEAARRRGATAVTGLGMLIHQAAHAFRLWTGEDPPLEAMSAAALGALRR
jgi:shikimate dehydrogenase